MKKGFRCIIYVTLSILNIKYPSHYISVDEKQPTIHKWGILLFAIVEILIGSITYIAVSLSLIQGTSASRRKSWFLVLTTACISALGLVY